MLVEMRDAIIKLANAKTTPTPAPEIQVQSATPTQTPLSIPTTIPTTSPTPTPLSARTGTRYQTLTQKKKEVKVFNDEEEEEEYPQSPPTSRSMKFPQRPQKKQVQPSSMGPGRHWVWKEKQRLLEYERERQERVAEHRQQELHRALLNNAESYGDWLDTQW
jgi:hypothetical protein